LTKSVLAGDKLGEPDASSAVDAASHGCLDERSQLLVLNSTFVLHEATLSVSIDLRDILKITFATLIANRAVKRVVGQEEFHDTTIIIKFKSLIIRIIKRAET